MRKWVLAALIALFLCGQALAAGPAIEEGNRIQFTAADQETSTIFRIRAIAWISAAGSEIGADDGFLLEDAAGTVVVGAEATAVSDQFIITFPGAGLVVAGLKAEDLGGGYLYIFGERL